MPKPLLSPPWLPQLLLLLMAALIPAESQMLRIGETRTAAVSNSKAHEVFIEFTQPANQSMALLFETSSSDHKSLLFVAKQQDTADTWWLPYSFVETNRVGDEVARTAFLSVGRTLCPAPVRAQEQRIRVHLTTSTHSSEPIRFHVTAQLVSDFHLQLGTPVSGRLLPSSPRLFYFQFDDDMLQDDQPIEAVRVEVESADDACGLVSVQSSRCPVHKMPPAVLHTGYRQTFLSSAVILMRRDEYRSFFVVLTAFPSNRRCLSKWKQEEQRAFDGKNFTMRVEKVQTHRNVGGAVAGLVGSFLILNTILAVIVFIGIYIRSDIKLKLKPLSEGSETTQQKATSGCLLACQLLAIVIFYGLPVVQLLLQKQSDVSTGGDMDKCYYNFKCRFYVRVAGRSFYTFNSFISNVGYATAGCAFCICVMIKQCLNRGCSLNGPSIPRCYSAYYGAGIALAMEGVLSAFYHVCPTHDNFQFDTAFMFMLCGMVGLAVYCKRNPSTNMLTGAVIVAGTAIVLLNSVGILLSKISATWLSALKISLAILLLLSSITISCVARKKSQQCKKLLLLIPFAVLHAVCGIVYIFLGAYRTSSSLSFLVLIFIGSNTVLYLIFYLANKCCCQHTKCTCRVGLACAFLFILSVVLISLSAKHYFQSPTDWDESPAESRARNSNCLVRWFGVPFDHHDLWHLLGSHGIYCLLLLVLFLDADEESGTVDNELAF